MCPFIGLSEVSKSRPADEKPLPSKNLVEGLIKENSRLKQQIDRPQKVEELSIVGVDIIYRVPGFVCLFYLKVEARLLSSPWNNFPFMALNLK